MSDDQNLSDTDDVGSDESPVITKLRKENRDLAKELKELRAEREERAAAEAKQRESAVEEIVNALDVPKLKDDVLNWVEGPVTEQSVREALEARGIVAPAEGTNQSDGDAGETSNDEAPAGRPASSIGQRVADAASGRAEQSITERLAAAKDNAEIAAIMREVGAATHYE